MSDFRPAAKAAIGAFALAVAPGSAPLAMAQPLPPAALRALHDCPARSVERVWPKAADVKHWRIGQTQLFIVRCETAGDDEYYAAVTKTGGRFRRQTFPGAENGRLVADLVDREAQRSRRLGQLTWDPRRQELMGEISAGCGGRTEYFYRWVGERFLLTRQRSTHGCDTPRWIADYPTR